MKARLASVIVAFALSVHGGGCATTGADGEGNRDLPLAGVGPFRRLTDDEVRGIAPFVLEDRVALYREPTAVTDVDGSVVLFAVARAGDHDVIVRTRATDGRSFYGGAGDFGRTPPVVLEPTEAWEGGVVSAPSVVRRGAEWLLYHAGAGGIGLARSADGVHFRKEPGPVLAVAPSSWESGPPGAPGVYLAEDGRVRLFYAAGGGFGEAESDDGVVFRRLPGPVLTPSAAGATRISDPTVSPRLTPAGRWHVRVLYTHVDAAGASSIRFAARYGDDGPLEAQPVAVYAVGQGERAPAFVDHAGRTLLYVQQERRGSADERHPGIAAAVAPADATLPPPAPFPDGP